MTARNYISLLGIFEFFAVSLLFVWPSLTWSQTVVATVLVGPSPRALAVNPVTNKIYVATCHPSSGRPPVGGLSVIDGETNATTTIPVGCAALAVNSVTNKIYVVNAGNATVIDGATNSTTTLSASGSAVAVNEVTNKIYVAKGSVNGANATITVIDGATNSTNTIAEPNTTGLNSASIAVNSATNKIYVTNSNLNASNSNPGAITVIDGVTNTTTTISDPNAISPVGVAVNPNTNKIYVANMGNYPGTNHGNVTVIDGSTNSITTISDPNALSPGGPDSQGFAVAVNSSTNKIYVSNEGSNNVTVIDGVTNATTTLTDPSAVAPVAVAVDSATNRAYVSNRGVGPGSVTVIDGTTNSFTTVMAPDGATDAAAVNPMTNRIYAGDGSNVTVIDGSGSATSHTLILTLAGSGFGAVSSSPSAINCNGPSCSASFPVGTAATFTAAPTSYSTFSGWGAACLGTNPCNLTMDSDHFVTATFAMKPGIDFSLQPASSSLTAEHGSQVSDVITVSGNPEAVVQLSCIQSGPTPASCTLSPSSVTLAGGSIAATLTVTIGSQAATLVRARKRHRTFYAGFLPISGLALVGLCLARARSRTQTRLLWLLCSVLFLPGGLSSGCGSGNNGPLRTYTTVIVGNVIGFSGAIEHTTSITVTAP